MVVEDSRVKKLELRLVPSSVLALFDEPAIGVFGLRVFIERPHIRMGGRRVEIVVLFFDVLTMIALGAGEPKEALFENGILPVPQSQSKTQSPLAIADPQ
jgi:hypothetical protein